MASHGLLHSITLSKFFAEGFALAEPMPEQRADATHPSSVNVDRSKSKEGASVVALTEPSAANSSCRCPDDSTASGNNEQQLLTGDTPGCTSTTALSEHSGFSPDVCAAEAAPTAGEQCADGATGPQTPNEHGAATANGQVGEQRREIELVTLLRAAMARCYELEDGLRRQLRQAQEEKEGGPRHRRKYQERKPAVGAMST
ncbi:unnamed protein product, partial [Trypanosoma congolense IL3000]